MVLLSLPVKQERNQIRIFPPDSSQLSTYLAEHDYAVQWAIANRDLVAHRVKECMSPSESDRSGPLPRKIVDVTHNSVTRHQFTINDESKELWVHEKRSSAYRQRDPRPALALGVILVGYSSRQEMANPTVRFCRTCAIWKYFHVSCQQYTLWPMGRAGGMQEQHFTMERSIEIKVDNDISWIRGDMH